MSNFSNPSSNSKTLSFTILRPWPNDLIFHSVFSSTFGLKVERWLCVVEHVWANDSIFRSTSFSTFQLLIFPQRVSAKNIYHHLFFSTNETLLRMLSLDFLDKMAKRLGFHSTTVLLLDFFDKDQTSLKITRLNEKGGQTARLFARFSVE